MPDLPRISIIVPNYNGAATLERTLESLWAQNYPDLEILVADGGSTDASPDILRRCAPRLAWWVSEKDRGQSHAINKGFAHATGQIVNWICSDDLLTPGALHTIGTCFAAHPEIDVLSGAGRLISADRSWQRVKTPTLGGIRLLPCTNVLPQASTFYRRRLLDRPGPLREDLHFTMDLELWTYFASRGARFHAIPEVLSEAIQSGQNKLNVGGPAIVREWKSIYRAYTHERIPLTFWHSLLRHPLARVQRRSRFAALRRGAAWTDPMIQRALGKFYGYDRVHALDWSWTIDAR